MDRVREAMTALSAALADFEPASLVGIPVEDLAALLASSEQVRRQLPVLEHAAVSALDEQHAARSLSEYGARSTAGLLERMLRISGSDARQRVEYATTLGVETIRAQAAGAIGAAHVREIQYTLDELRTLPATNSKQNLSRRPPRWVRPSSGHTVCCCATNSTPPTSVAPPKPTNAAAT